MSTFSYISLWEISSLSFISIRFRFSSTFDCIWINHVINESLLCAITTCLIRKKILLEVRKLNKGRFCNTIESVAFGSHLHSKRLANTDNRNSLNQYLKKKHSHKVNLKQVRQTLTWCGRREVFKRSYVLAKEEGG